MFYQNQLSFERERRNNYSEHNLRYCLFLFVLVALCATLGSPLFAQEQDSLRFNINLKARSFIPAPGIDSLFQDSLTVQLERGMKRHVLIQLTELPDRATRQLLIKKGIWLLSYIGRKSYYAVVSKPNALLFDEPKGKRDRALSLIRWMGQIEAEDRVNSDVLEGKFGEWAINDDGTVKIRVMFFDDVDSTAQMKRLNRYSSEFNQHSPNIWQLNIERDKIRLLITEDDVHWIEQEPRPYEPLNDVTRNEIGVDVVQNFNPIIPTYNGYSGNGIQAMIRDSGIDGHDDFQGRLFASNSPSGSHGTHVAGILGGSGFRSNMNDANGNPNGGTAFQWRGMAPEVELVGYYFGWDAPTYNTAMSTYGVDISNHSHTQIPAGTYDYNTDAKAVENIVRDDTLYVVTAAGNNGTHPNNNSPLVGYFSFTGTIAKNNLSLGNYNSATRLRWRGSSMGPTFDGRIKPDVMAPGRATSTVFNNGYGFKSGTSMASPCAAGVTALMLEAFWDRYGANKARPLFSTMKAILIETAEDLVQAPYVTGEPNCPDFVGTNAQPPFFHTGPDWATGYGLINAEEAVLMIRNKKLFLQDSIHDIGDTDEFLIFVPAGTQELKVTLVWDDYPGDLTTPNTSAKLMNDLNLELIEPIGGAIHHPWVLSPINLANDGNINPADITAATTGVDHLNNVEQVQVLNPRDGFWMVRINESGMPQPSQSYSIASNLALIIPRPQRFSLSYHSGVAIPVGSFANDFDPGLNILLDLDYHFSQELSIVLLFGYNDFQSRTTGIDDNYWLNLSLNARYYWPWSGPWSIYVGGGPGVYFPENGDNEFGANIGLGINYDFSPRIKFEIGSDYHTIFDPDIQFVHSQAGVIFRF